MCQTAICPLCNKKSWTGCGNHLPTVFGSTSESFWCTCRHTSEDGNMRFPPKAGTGCARRSVSSETSF